MPFIIIFSLCAYVATAFLWLVELIWLIVSDKEEDSLRHAMEPLTTTMAVLILYDIASVIPVSIYFLFIR